MAAFHEAIVAENYNVFGKFFFFFFCKVPARKKKSLSSFDLVSFSVNNEDLAQTP